jgi:hypothetical protein
VHLDSASSLASVTKDGVLMTPTAFRHHSSARADFESSLRYRRPSPDTARR